MNGRFYDFNHELKENPHFKIGCLLIPWMEIFISFFFSGQNDRFINVKSLIELNHIPYMYAL